VELVSDVLENKTVHDVTTQKTMARIFIAVKTSAVASEPYLCCMTSLNQRFTTGLITVM